MNNKKDLNFFLKKNNIFLVKKDLFCFGSFFKMRYRIRYGELPPKQKFTNGEESFFAFAYDPSDESFILEEYEKFIDAKKMAESLFSVLNNLDF